MVRRDRRGFTLVELLVVIGIILLLMSIAVIGFIHLEKVGSEKSTQTKLTVCQSMQAEYEAENQLQYIEGGPADNPAPFYVSALNGGLRTQAVNPGSVVDGQPNRLETLGETSFMVETTGQIINLFTQLPKVKTDLTQLGSTALLQGPGGGTWLDKNQKPVYVVLDAWRNPIIYVPSTGLPGITLSGHSGLVTIVSLDGRPFWASAGHDGNFNTGDDNLYSVPVKFTSP